MDSDIVGNRQGILILWLGNRIQEIAIKNNCIQTSHFERVMTAVRYTSSHRVCGPVYIILYCSIQLDRVDLTLCFTFSLHVQLGLLITLPVLFALNHYLFQLN
jgi:hypothetical protein